VESQREGLYASVEKATQGGASPEAIAETIRRYGTPELFSIWSDQSKGVIGKLADTARLLTQVPYVEPGDRRRTSQASKVLIASTARLEKIQPAVQQLRMAIFGSSDPPFEEYGEDAVAWLEEQGDAKEEEAEIDAFAIAMAGPRLVPEWTTRNFDLTPRRRRLMYLDPRSMSINSVGVGMNTLLDQVRYFVVEAESLTRFSPWALLMHFLTDLRPPWPRWIISESNGEPTIIDSDGKEMRTRRFFAPFERHEGVSEGWNVVINAADITWEEWQEIFKAIEDLRGPRRLLVGHKDQILLEVIYQNGGAPAKGALGNGAFWRKVQEGCRLRGIDSFGSPDAPRRRYGRLVQRGLVD
jgi:hypothetical protein